MQSELGSMTFLAHCILSTQTGTWHFLSAYYLWSDEMDICLSICQRALHHSCHDECCPGLSKTILLKTNQLHSLPHCPSTQTLPLCFIVFQIYLLLSRTLHNLLILLTVNLPSLECKVREGKGFCVFHSHIRCLLRE